MLHRMSGPFLLLAAAMICSPALSAQTSQNANTKKSPAANSATVGPLSHDLSGVWMQYDDGTAPGFARMNGVDDRARPPLTPWGQEKFDAAKPLMGPRAVGGQEDSAALHCDPSGPPQLLILPNPWEIVQVPGRMFMFFGVPHLAHDLDRRAPAAERLGPKLARLLGRTLGRRHVHRRHRRLQRQGVGRSFRQSAQRRDAPNREVSPPQP